MWTPKFIQRRRRMKKFARAFETMNDPALRQAIADKRIKLYTREDLITNNIDNIEKIKNVR